MRLLVTGGAGFIGSNFVHHLLSTTEHEVVTFDALTYAGSKDNLGATLDDPRHKFVEGDIRDSAAVAEALDGVNAVVNFAAESHVDRSIEGSESFMSTNIAGTQVLLDASLDHNIETFVQISTDEVYGQTLEGEFDEADPLDPRNPYSATKASADLLALSYHTTHNLPVVIARSSNNFGPRQHPEKLIPKFITRAANGESLPLYGDGKHIREWLFVRDNCQAIEHLLINGEEGEIYNIGSGVELTNYEVARRIVDAVNTSEDLIEFVDDRPGHDRRYALDTDKMTEIGWEPKISFDEGLRRTVDYYLS